MNKIKYIIVLLMIGSIMFSNEKIKYLFFEQSFTNQVVLSFNIKSKKMEKFTDVKEGCFFEYINNKSYYYQFSNNVYIADFDIIKKEYSLNNIVKDVYKSNDFNIVKKENKRNDKVMYCYGNDKGKNNLIVEDKNKNIIFSKEYDYIEDIYWLEDDKIIITYLIESYHSDIIDINSNTINKMNGYVIGVSDDLKKYFLIPEFGRKLLMINYKDQKKVWKYNDFDFTEAYLIENYIILIYNELKFIESKIIIYDYKNKKIIYKNHIYDDNYNLIGKK